MQQVVHKNHQFSVWKADRYMTEMNQARIFHIARLFVRIRLATPMVSLKQGVFAVLRLLAFENVKIRPKNSNVLIAALASLCISSNTSQPHTVICTI